MQNLPVNGRQMSQLMLQAPGSQNAGTGTWGDIRFSGRAVEQNVIKYDGIEGSAIIDASPGNANGENNLAINFGGMFVATDSDGDSVPATGSFTLTKNFDAGSKIVVYLSANNGSNASPAGNVSKNYAEVSVSGTGTVNFTLPITAPFTYDASSDIRKRQTAASVVAGVLAD